MHFQFTMSSIFDWEVRRLGMRERVKTRNDNGLRIWIFSQKLPFTVEKKEVFFFFGKKRKKKKKKILHPRGGGGGGGLSAQRRPWVHIL